MSARRIGHLQSSGSLELRSVAGHPEGRRQGGTDPLESLRPHPVIPNKEVESSTLRAVLINVEEETIALMFLQKLMDLLLELCLSHSQAWKWIGRSPFNVMICSIHLTPEAVEHEVSTCPLQLIGLQIAQLAVGRRAVTSLFQSTQKKDHLDNNLPRNKD